MNEMCLEESYSVTHLQNGATQRTHLLLCTVLQPSATMSTSTTNSNRPSSSEARRLRVEQLRQKHASRRSLVDVGMGEEGVAALEPTSRVDPTKPTAPALSRVDNLENSDNANDDVSDEEEPSISSQSSVVPVAKKKQSGRKRFSHPGIERGLAALVSSRAGGSSRNNNNNEEEEEDKSQDDEEAQRESLRHHKRQRRTKSSSRSNSKSKPKPLHASSSRNRTRNKEINISPRATDEDLSLFNNTQEDREARLDRIRAGVASLSLLLQGILAGFAISTLLMAIPKREDSVFIADYAQHANEHRRFYFLVITACLSSSLCLVVPPRDSLGGGGATGAIGGGPASRDMIGTLPEGMLKWWWIVALCYFIGLVLTLPIAVVDVKLAMPDNDDGIGADDIRLWRSLSIIRSICCLLAWVLVCWQQSKAYERRREILKWYN